MGWLSDLGHYVNPFDASSTFQSKILGGDAADAASEAGELQRAANVEASALFDPFQQIGQSGIEQAGFLTDPNAQFDYLQSNPLFQMGLDNLNSQTRRSAAASGRLSGDDTAMQFNNNALLAASPLIEQQSNAIGGLLDFGNATAANQGNLLTGAAAAQAGGVVGASNAESQGTNNALGLIGTFASLFSDERLKTNITKVGEQNGFNKYSWTWNEKANDIGLSGDAVGVIAQEVQKTNPDAVIESGDYLTVDYEMIGVNQWL